MNGGEWGGQHSHEEERKEKVLSVPQLQTLRDLHRKVKGTYMQLTQLLDELDILIRKC